MSEDPSHNIKDEDVRRSLVQAAHRIFQERFGREGELEAELKQIEKRPFGTQKRKLELEAKIKAKSVYAKRLADFGPLLGSELICPKCWLLEGRTVSVTEWRIGHYRFSFEFELRCPHCRERFAV